jgi:hypothetical protein
MFIHNGEVAGSIHWASLPDKLRKKLRPDEFPTPPPPAASEPEPAEPTPPEPKASPKAAGRTGKP